MKAKKLLAGILSAAMVLSSMALPAFAEDKLSSQQTETTYSNEYNVYDLANQTSDLTIGDEKVVLKGTAPTGVNITFTNSIREIILDNVTVDTIGCDFGAYDYSAIEEIWDLADDTKGVSVKLNGANTVNNYLNLNCRIFIDEYSGSNGATLSVGSTNNFDSQGINAGDVVINGGNITAYSSSGNTAAIGGNYFSYVHINGGIVNATSTEAGAAIGGGNIDSCVKITDGIVNATSTGTGAAIGGGNEAQGNGYVWITGGIVNATSKSGSALGCGKNAGGDGWVAIEDGTITVNSTGNGALLGKRLNKAGWHAMTIEGGTFNTDVSAYLAEGKMLVKNSDGAYVVTDVKEVEEKLDNENVTTEEKVETINSVVISTDNTQVTEKVVETIKTLPVEKKEEIAPAKVEEIIATKTESDVKTATAATTASEDEDTVAVTAKLTSIDSSLTLNVQPKTTDSSIQLPAGTKAARFEVKVEKTTDDTTETVTETEVPMLLTFELADGVSAKSVIRIHDGKQESVPFTQDGTTVKVTAAKFSEYAVVLPADTPAAGGAVLTFEDDIDGDGICNIYLVGDENATVTNFESGEFAIANNASSGKVGMVLEGAKDTDGNALLTIDEVSEGCYKIHRPNGTVAYPEADGTN